MVMSLDLLVFGHKAKYWTNWNFDLMVALDGNGVTKVITVNPEGGLNVCRKFHCNPSNSCWDILFKTTNVNLVVVLEKR